MLCSAFTSRATRLPAACGPRTTGLAFASRSNACAFVAGAKSLVPSPRRARRRGRRQSPVARQAPTAPCRAARSGAIVQAVGADAIRAAVVSVDVLEVFKLGVLATVLQRRDVALIAMSSIALATEWSSVAVRSSSARTGVSSGCSSAVNTSRDRDNRCSRVTCTFS